MNIQVFVKRVPDTEAGIRIDAGSRSLIENGLSFVLNPYDEFAVEEALRLREAHGGVVRVFTAGGEASLAILRKCLAMGADEAVLVRDIEPESFDGLRTSRILAAASNRFPGADLLLFGRQSADTGNGQVPAMTAEALGFPHIDAAVRLEIRGAEGTALREIEEGLEKIDFSLPAVVSAHKGLNEPRYETLRGILAAKKKEIPVISLENLELSAETLPSRVETAALDVPVRKGSGKILRGTPEETAKELLDLLRAEKGLV